MFALQIASPQIRIMKPLNLGPNDPNARFRGLLDAEPLEFEALAGKLVAEELFERVRVGRHGGQHDRVTLQRLLERLGRYRRARRSSPGLR